MKVLFGLSFAVFIGSEVVVAMEQPYDKVYRCADNSEIKTISGLGGHDFNMATLKWPLLYFMKDGGFTYTHSSYLPPFIWETYKSNTYPQLYETNAATTQMDYNDLGGFHEFIIDSDWTGKHYWHQIIVLDKDPMVGTLRDKRTEQGKKYLDTKVSYHCLQVFPWVYRP